MRYKRTRRIRAHELFSPVKHVLLLNNIPAPYFIPLFQRLAGVEGWKLTVCYASQWKPDVGWSEKLAADALSMRTVYLDQQDRGWMRRRLGSRLASALVLLGILWRERPDYLLCYGYTLAPQLTLLSWGLLSRTPFGIIGDANIHCDRTRGIKRWLKRSWLRLLTRRAAAVLTIGTANRQFWESYLARPEKLYSVPFSVDNEYFIREAEARSEEARSLSERWGLRGKVIFLSVGRLVARKNVALLIEAFHSLADERAALVIAGAGEEREALERLANGHPRIIFTGGIAPRQLPLYYAMADVMVLAARDEPWGLVTNEAMACGLAVIAHRQCGSTVDLVDNENGIVLQSFAVEELAGAMRRMIENNEMRIRMQANSRQKIAAWTIEAAAAGVIRAVESSGGVKR